MTILVKQGDSPSSPVYPAEHFLIPQFQGRTYEEVEGNIPASDCVDLKKAIEDCNKVYAEFLEKYGSDGEPATPYGSMPVVFR